MLHHILVPLSKLGGFLLLEQSGTCTLSKKGDDGVGNYPAG